MKCTHRRTSTEKRDFHLRLFSGRRLAAFIGNYDDYDDAADGGGYAVCILFALITLCFLLSISGLPTMPPFPDRSCLKKLVADHFSIQSNSVQYKEMILTSKEGDNDDDDDDNFDSDDDVNHDCNNNREKSRSQSSTF